MDRKDYKREILYPEDLKLDLVTYMIILAELKKKKKTTQIFLPVFLLSRWLINLNILFYF